MFTSVIAGIFNIMHTVDIQDIVPEETVPPMKEKTVSGFSKWLVDVSEWMFNFAKDVMLPVGIKLVIALFIFLIGKKIVNKAVKMLGNSLRKSNVEEGTIHFLSSLLKGAGMVVLVFIVANYLDFSTGPIVAILGSAGLAVGLAMQGSLANFAGGVLILVMKPFRIGDYICALGNEGTVVGIDMVYTTLLTVDNRKVVIPNGTLSNANIVNVTNEPNRRVDILVGVDYSSDILEVKSILLDIAKKHELVLQDMGIDVYVNSFDASAVSMGLRAWTETENYWQVKWDLQEQIKLVFDERGISIPFERIDVNVMDKK